MTRQLALFPVTGRSRAEKSQALFRRRRDRLISMATSIQSATEALRALAEKSARTIIRIRPEFVDFGSNISTEASDRRTLERNLRPPATRLISSRGAALRLMLIALYEVQLRSRLGSHYENFMPLCASSSGEIGWTDLFATDAKPSGEGSSYMSVTAKKMRQLRQTLDRLNSEKLVAANLQRTTGGTYERFLLLHESGRPHETRRHAYRDMSFQEQCTNLPYQVPRRNEPTFPLPVHFFTNGWIHVLEDTEIAFLLIASLMSSLSRNRETFVIKPEQRALRFGLGRDAFGAHKMLQAMGLLSVLNVDQADISSREAGNGNIVPPLAFKLHSYKFATDGYTRTLQVLDSLIT